MSDDIAIVIVRLARVHVLVKYADFLLIVPTSRSEGRNQKVKFFQIDSM